MVDHLASAGLRHWDPAMRQLAARAMAALVPITSPSTRAHMATQLFDMLLHATEDSSLDVRDGAVWGLAELLTAFWRQGGSSSNDAHMGALIDAKRCQAVGAVPGRLRDAQFLAGKGGETLRVAVCHLVASGSASGLVLDAATAEVWLEVVESSLMHPAPTVQQAATRALPCLVTYVDRDCCSLFVSCEMLCHTTHVVVLTFIDDMHANDNCDKNLTRWVTRPAYCHLCAYHYVHGQSTVNQCTGHTYTSQGQRQRWCSACVTCCRGGWPWTPSLQGGPRWHWACCLQPHWLWTLQLCSNR